MGLHTVEGKPNRSAEEEPTAGERNLVEDTDAAEERCCNWKGVGCFGKELHIVAEAGGVGQGVAAGNSFLKLNSVKIHNENNTNSKFQEFVMNMYSEVFLFVRL